MEKRFLVIIRGLPGSGKSTLANSLSKRGYAHFENDMYFMKDGKYCFDLRKAKDAANWCFKSAKTALEAGKNVVVSNVFVTNAAVDRYRRLAKTLKVGFKVVRCTADYGNVHDVPQNVLDSMAASFEDVADETMHVKE